MMRRHKQILYNECLENDQRHKRNKQLKPLNLFVKIVISYDDSSTSPIIILSMFNKTCENDRPNKRNNQ